jgi:tRNA U34 5-carboxymethylaminomethyl modifying GTPase MnmE/TrmE
MESALKTAIDRAESQYSVKLAEEINKFDTKLSEEMAAEDAKYNASFSERLRVIEKLHNDVSVLETVLLTNAARLKENIQLHNVSAALFELGHTTLSSPVTSYL